MLCAEGYVQQRAARILQMLRDFFVGMAVIGRRLNESLARTHCDRPQSARERKLAFAADASEPTCSDTPSPEPVSALLLAATVAAAAAVGGGAEIV